MKKPDFRRFLRENPDRVRSDPEDGALFATLLRRLRAMPEPAARGDFADRLMERLRREEAAARACGGAGVRRRPLQWALRVAAVLALAVSGAAGLRSLVRPGEDSAALAMARTAAACKVIVAGQGADGAWHAATEVPGGNSFRSGRDGALSAIALMALMHNGADPLHGPHASSIRSGMENLVALQADPQGLGDGATRAGRSSRYLVSMALRAGAALPGAPAGWRDAAGRAALAAPDSAEAMDLNRRLARASSMPEPWRKAGGPVLAASLELLRPRTL